MHVPAERLLHLRPCLDTAMRSNPDHQKSWFHLNMVGHRSKYWVISWTIGRGTRVPLRQEIKVLISWLKKWETHFGAISVAPTLWGMCRWTWILLEGSHIQMEVANNLWKVLKKNWEHCGEPKYESTSKLRAEGMHDIFLWAVSNFHDFTL